MPLYEYACKASHKSERIYRINDRRRIIQCDECKKPAARIISAPTVHDFEEHLDENLAAEGSGELFHVKSRDHKKRRLRDLGLAERGPSERARDRQMRGTIFSYAGGKP